MIPRKQRNEDGGEAYIEKEKAEPIVTFSKPPPLPPVLGPLVAISILESSSNNDDWQVPWSSFFIFGNSASYL